MPLFSYKNRKVVVPPPAPQVQNIYSAYSHHAPSPPPPPFMENKDRPYNNDVRRQLKEHEDVEKFNHHKFLLHEVEKKNKGKSTYSRILCCCCFPCLPMWTRTVFCFIFLALCGFIGLVSFFVMTFKKPQIVFNGLSPQMADPLNTNNLRLQFSVYNGNFLEFDFDSIKAVIYYPTPNKTTLGVGEISDLVLGPRIVTNITFPIQVMGGDYKGSETNVAKDGTMIQSTSYNHNEEAFAELVVSSCNQNNSTDSNQRNDKKEVVVVFDLMPTIKVYGYPIITLAFTGQSTKMSCEKLNSLIKKNDQTFNNKPQ